MLISAALFGSLCATGIATGAEPAEDGQQAEDKPIEMHVQVAVDRFAMKSGRAYAEGPVTLRTTESDGTRETVRSDVRLRIDGKKDCEILKLRIEKLFVALLGLEVTTSEINLEITGRNKGSLGKLFCKLSEGLKLNKKQLTKRTVRSLNRRLDGEQLNLVRINAKLHPRELESSTTRAPNDGGPRCQILDVDIGPLELDLLGLAVDLYGADKETPVHIDADADPNGGVIGEALCQVSGGPTEPTP